MVGDPFLIDPFLIDQVEFANVILLNKIDLLPEKNKHHQITEIKRLISRLNPKAKVIIPELPKFKNFDIEKVMNTNLFDMEEAQNSAGWLAELEKPVHNPETEEYGISSFVFSERSRPFHPKRLNDILDGFGNLNVAKTEIKINSNENLFVGVVRAKGFLWIANVDACPVDIHSAGRHLELVPNINRPWCKKLVEIHPNGDDSDKNCVEQD